MGHLGLDARKRMILALCAALRRVGIDDVQRQRTETEPRPLEQLPAGIGRRFGVVIM